MIRSNPGFPSQMSLIQLLSIFYFFPKKVFNLFKPTAAVVVFFFFFFNSLQILTIDVSKSLKLDPLNMVLNVMPFPWCSGYKS